MDNEKGPDAAKHWAMKIVGFSPDQIRVLSAHIKEEFRKRGFVAK